MIRALHRRLAWIAGFAALAWTLTGMLHPIMMWTAPRPAVQTPPAMTTRLDGLAPPGRALVAAGVREANLVRLAVIDGAPIWLASTPDARALVAIDARTGAEVSNAERAHAIALARQYAQLPQAEIQSARRIEDFSLAYPSVNAILPVWEVKFADAKGLTLYVDPRADRLAAASDDLRRTLLGVFQNIHTLNFFSSVPPLRIAAILVLVGTALAASLIGAALAISAKGRSLRAWHRFAGLAALPFVISFAASGLFHLLASPTRAPPAPAPAFDVAQLTHLPRVSGARLASLVVTASADGPLWRAVANEGRSGLYFGSDGAWRDLDDAARARQIARVGATAETRPVFGFNAEYGFVNKRLPVLRVQDDATLRFVSLEEGIVVSDDAPDPLARAEAWSFDTIHKWNFLNPIGRFNRDLAMMAAVALIAAVACAGLALNTSRRQARPGGRS